MAFPKGASCIRKSKSTMLRVSTAHPCLAAERKISASFRARRCSLLPYCCSRPSRPERILASRQTFPKGVKISISKRRLRDGAKNRQMKVRALEEVGASIHFMKEIRGYLPKGPFLFEATRTIVRYTKCVRTLSVRIPTEGIWLPL